MKNITKSWPMLVVGGGVVLLFVLSLPPLLLREAAQIIAPSVALAQAPDEGTISEEDLEGEQSDSPAPERMLLKFSDQPPRLSEEEIARREQALRDSYVPEAALEASPEDVVPPDGGETAPQHDVLAPPDFNIWRTSTLAPTSGNSDINEPAVGNGGKYVWYAGNWYAARSTDGGVSWTYTNPATSMSDFCCDQDVIYDESRDQIIWYRQGSYQSSTGQNRFILSRSTDGGATWCSWSFFPTTFNSTWTNQWFDYPHLALSNDFLWLTTNRIAGGGTTVNLSVLARFSLDTIRSCGTLGATFWTQSSGRTWTPVQGARETMYVGRIDSTSSLTVYWNDESSTTLSSVTRTIPTWTSGSMTCTLPNGDNPCARSDNRIKAGWVAKGLIGFFWNVAAGGGFPMPYVNAARFRESDKTYVDRPYLWCCSSGTSVAWHYAAASPNKRGDLAIASWTMGGGIYPQFNVGIDDDFNGTPPGWELAFVASSASGPGSNTWGDYLRVRPHAPGGFGWIASGYTSNANGVSQPRYTVFSRGRDEWNVKRWWDQP
jgi:hypothetical protein